MQKISKLEQEADFMLESFPSLPIIRMSEGAINFNGILAC